MSQLIIDLDAPEGHITAAITFLEIINGVDKSEPLAFTREGNTERVGLSDEPEEAVSGGEVIPVDKAGYPYDARIHSSGKTKTAAGVWSRRRNIDDDFYKAVQAELISARIPEAGSSEPARPSLVNQAETHNRAVEQQQQGAPAVEHTATPSGQSQREQIAATPADGVTWGAVLQRITNATTAGVFDIAKRDAFLAANQVGGIALLATRPDLFEAFLFELGI